MMDIYGYLQSFADYIDYIWFSQARTSFKHGLQKFWPNKVPPTFRMFSYLEDHPDRNWVTWSQVPDFVVDPTYGSTMLLINLN